MDILLDIDIHLVRGNLGEDGNDPCLPCTRPGNCAGSFVTSKIKSVESGP